MADTKQTPDISKLKFIRVQDAILIPRYLFDQAKGLPWKVENFYKFFDFFGQSPFTFLFAIADTKDIELPIKGVIWAAVNPIANSLDVNFVSVHKDYQRTGLFKDRIIPHIIEIRDKCNLDKIFWATTRPKAFERLSEQYKRSELVVMELNGGDNGRR